MKFLIVSGGEATDEFVEEVIKKGGFDVILAADSGMDFLYRTQILPDIIVGDFDSVEPKVLDFFREKEQIDICALNPVKDDTDTEFAIREAIRRGATDITIIGGTGTRLDHVLGNISLLGIGLEEGVRMELLDAHNRICIHSSQPAFWVYVNIFFIKVIIWFWYGAISKAIWQQRFLADVSFIFRAIHQQKDSRSGSSVTAVCQISLLCTGFFSRMFCQFLTGFGGHFTVSAACLCSSCTKVCSSGRRVPLSG